MDRGDAPRVAPAIFGIDVPMVLVMLNRCQIRSLNTEHTRVSNLRLVHTTSLHVPNPNSPTDVIETELETLPSSSPSSSLPREVRAWRDRRCPVRRAECGWNPMGKKNQEDLGLAHV